jgi:hypothetical protein
MAEKLTSTNYTYIDLVALSIDGLWIEVIINICESPGH